MAVAPQGRVIAVGRWLGEDVSGVGRWLRHVVVRMAGVRVGGCPARGTRINPGRPSLDEPVT